MGSGAGGVRGSIGSGKSTVLKLLIRKSLKDFLTAEKGDIGEGGGRRIKETRVERAFKRNSLPYKDCTI